MAFRIAIVEDSDIDAEYEQGIVKAWAKERETDVRIRRFVRAESFLFCYEDDKAWDILLLDIEMGAMDGVALAKRIREENEEAQIIFITGFPDFMAEGYEVSALHYLMKPVSDRKLYSVLDKAVGNLNKNEKQLILSFNRQTQLVPLRGIMYIEAQKQYVAVHTESGEYRRKTSLAEMEKELDEYFFKCQRSFIVNLRQVLRIHSDRVVLKNGAEIPISRGMASKIGKEIIRLF